MVFLMDETETRISAGGEERTTPMLLLGLSMTTARSMTKHPKLLPPTRVGGRRAGTHHNLRTERAAGHPQAAARAGAVEGAGNPPARSWPPNRMGRSSLRRNIVGGRRSIHSRAAACDRRRARQERQRRYSGLPCDERNAQAEPRRPVAARILAS
jgi:hypothetical protein